MKSQTITKLLEPTADEIESTLALAAKMGVGRPGVARFFAETDRLPDRDELTFLAKGYSTVEAIHMSTSGAVLKDGPAPAFVHVKRNVWKPDAPRGAPWVVAYATLEIQHGRVHRILDLRVHDGDDARFAKRDASGQIVKLPPGDGFFQSSMTIVRAADFEAAHIMPDNVAKESTWPNRNDGESWKGFETNQEARSMWFVMAILRPLHEAFVGKHVDDIRESLTNAPAEIRMPEPTAEEMLVAENVALRAQLSEREALFEERLAALEARR